MSLSRSSAENLYGDFVMEQSKCSLTNRTCAPCQGSVEPLKGQNLNKLLDQLQDDWNVIDEHHLEKMFKFKDFKTALDFVNKVGELAESLSHHPDISLSWGKVKIKVFTHKIDGLHENDFIFAVKAQQLYSE